MKQTPKILLSGKDLES